MKAYKMTGAVTFAEVRERDTGYGSERKCESGRRASNPRPSAWEADALPTELLPRTGFVLGAPEAASRRDEPIAHHRSMRTRQRCGGYDTLGEHNIPMDESSVCMTSGPSGVVAAVDR